MLMNDMATCEQHKDVQAACFYCELIEEQFWKKNYLKILKQHMATVKELYELEEKCEEKWVS